MIAEADKPITDADWTMLLNSVVHKLHKSFRYLELNDLYSAAGMGLVIAFKKYDKDRSNNVMAYLTSKGYFIAFDILRNEWKTRSLRGPLHDSLYSYFGEEHPYQRTSPFQQRLDFEEALEHFSTSSEEKQILRERFLHGEQIDVIGKRRGCGKTAVSLRIKRILNKIREQLLSKDVSQKQRKQLENALNG